VAFRGEEGFLIPAEEASGGAEKGEVFASGAEFIVGIRERGHGVMMKQEKALWNVFLVRSGRVPCQNGSCLHDPHFKNRKP
jgi:hypothetical protein